MTAITQVNKLSTSWPKWGLRALSLGIFASVWEILANQIDSLLLPTFSATLVDLIGLLGTTELWQSFWISNQAMILGFLLSLAIGIPLGITMGRWQKAEKITNLYLNILLVTPMSALIPIFIIAIGLGLGSRVLVVFVFAVVVITVNTRAGLKSIDSTLIEMAHSFGATEQQLWQQILLPGALPAMATGVRLGLARAISGMIVVELLLVATGVGRLILSYQADFKSSLVYAVVFVVLIEAVILTWLINYITQKLLPWKSEVTIE